VALGFGGGVIAAGIKLAAADSRVSAAWSEFGDHAKAVLTEASGPFVQPLVDGAHKIGLAFDAEVPHIAGAFSQLAPVVGDLTDGVAGFIRELGPGLDKLANFSAPFLQDLAAYLPELGAHMKEFIDRISNAGPGVEHFFNDILDLSLTAIDALGNLVQWGSRAYDVFTALGSAVTGDVAGAQQRFADAWAKTAQSYGGFHNSTINVNTALGLYNGTVSAAAAKTGVFSDELTQTVAAVDRVLGATLGLDQANLGTATALTHLTESFKNNTVSARDHTAALNTATTAGQANVGAVLNVVQANISQYDAMIRAGAGAAEAAAAYDSNTAALDKQLHQAGLTQAQIDGLIGKYRNVPATVDTKIEMKGIEAALNDIDDVLRHVNGLPPRKDIYVQTHFSTTGLSSLYQSPDRVLENAATHAKGGIFAAATGAMIANSPTVLFGERQTGVEAFIPKLGISDAQGLAYANTAASWHGGHVVADRAGWGGVGGGGGPAAPIVVKLQLGADGYHTDLEAAIIGMIRAKVQSNGGSVQAVLGRGRP